MNPGKMSADDVRRMLANPFYAIEIAPVLAEPHRPMVSEEEWIGAATQDIKEFGAESFLRLLLDVLKGNFTVAPDATMN
jgi:hypothetical protein